MLTPDHSALAVPVDGEEVEIVGLIGASSPGGCGNGSGMSVIIFLSGWKKEGGTIAQEAVRVQMPVPEDDLRKLWDKFTSYSTVNLRGRFAGVNMRGGREFEASSIVQSAPDPDFIELARELQKPVIQHDDQFGSFLLDRSLDWFQARINWQGRQIDLTLNMEGKGNFSHLLSVAKKLHSDEGAWVEQLTSYAEKEVLPLMNQQWKEDEPPFSFEEFRELMLLDSIYISAPDLIGFHFDGPDMWQCFSIGASLSEGIYTLDIAH